MAMISKGEIFNELDMSLDGVIDDLIAKIKLDGTDGASKYRRTLIRLATLALFRADHSYGVTVEEADELARDCLNSTMKNHWRSIARLATNTSEVPN